MTEPTARHPPKILVCTVGGAWQPVVQAIQQNQPLTRVIFLCSTTSSVTEEHAASDRTVTEETQRTFPCHCPHCDRDFKATSKNPAILDEVDFAEDRYHIERIADPDDLDQVLDACERAEGWIADQDLAHCEVIANYTGGTKTMTFGLGHHGLRRGWKLEVIRTQGRHDLIKIDTAGVATAQSVSRALSSAALERAEELMQQHNFHGAVTIIQSALRDRGVTSAENPRLLRCQTESSLWVAWDAFDYLAARQLANDDPELKKSHASTLGKLVRTVELMAEGEAWPAGLDGTPLVSDILANAERCAQRQRFDDAVARLYRATELLAQLRLRAAYNTHTGAVNPKNPTLTPTARQWLSILGETTGGRPPFKLGLRQSYELLATLEDPLGQFFETQLQSLLGFIKVRNSAFHAHGLSPIGRKNWRKIGKPWIAWLRAALEQ